MSAGAGLARLKAALEKHGCKVKGSNAQCPAHEDDRPSLSIGQGKGKAILKCHGGCETDAVLEALGMSAADLADEPRDDGAAYTVTADYAYTDEHGEPLFYVERRIPKDFVQYRMVNGERVNSTAGVRRVPYRLPEVIAAAKAGGTVYVTEGEKDADAIVARGGVATCNPMGAGKWQKGFARYFRGAGRVIIVADADAKGREHAAKVAASVGEAAPVRVVEAAAGKDAWDHLAAGFGLDEFVDAAAPEPEPAAEPEAPRASLLAGLRNGAWLGAQQFPPLRYHVPGIVAEGVTVLAGAPKVGKSWLTLDLLLAAAAGGLALGAVQISEQGDVLYVALEDGDRRMQSRCRVLLRNEWRPDDPIPERFEYLTVITPGQLTATIAEWLERHPLGFVVVDTLGRVLPPADYGETSYMRDYRVMSDLKEVADAFPGAALLINHHDRKAVSADFVEQVSGTNGIAGGADTVLVLTRPRDEPDGLLQVTGRDVTEASYALTFERGLWELDGADLGQAAAAARERRAAAGLSDRSQEVVAFVASHPKGAGVSEVAAALEIDDHAARTYLSRLASSGRIRRLSRGVYVPVASVASVASAGQRPARTQHATQQVLRSGQAPDQATQQSQHSQPGGEDEGQRAFPWADEGLR